MSKLQKQVLETFMVEFGKPTLKEISKFTGIQATRVFRILNGYSMKVEEYETFQCLIYSKKGGSKDFMSLAWDCYLDLSDQELRKLGEDLYRSLKWKKIKHEQQYIA